MKCYRLLLAVFLMLATILFASPLVYANGGDEGNGAVIDISISGDPKGDTGGTCKISARREGSSEINTVLFLSPYGVTYSDGSNHAVIKVTNKAIIDITLRDNLVHIAASGTCEVNVRVEGPSEVRIDAGDEVELNVEAGDESQVFVDDEKLNDNPGEDSNPNVEASDASPVLVSDQNLNGAPSEDLDNPSLKLDDHTSRLNSMAIISGAFLGAGLLAFFLVRRKTKKG